MGAPDRFWLWWPIAGMVALTAAFLWFIGPIGLGFRFAGASGVRLQIADGVFRFSYFILNPSMLLAWLALPWFHRRGLAGFGWRLLSFIACLLAGCVGAVFALL